MAGQGTLSFSNQILRFAVQRNDYEGIRLILKRDCDLEAVDHDGQTVLYLACKNGYHNIVELLLENGASVYTTVEATGETALHVAAWRCREDTVALLLRHHADINAVTHDGETPLSLACLHVGIAEDSRVSELLIRSGANVNWVCTDQYDAGATLVHLAVNQSHLRALELLLKSTVNVNAVNNDGHTALHLSVSQYNLSTAKLLLKYGAQVNFPCQKRGFTALHFAVECKEFTMINLLLKYKADISVEDKKGSNPLHYASDRLKLPRLYITELTKVFAKHLVKMKAQNVFFSESSLKKLFKNEEMMKYCVLCENEVKWMRKKVMGDSNVKMFDIFTIGENRLADYVSNENVERVLESCSYDAKIPMYASLIHEKYLQGRERRDLLRHSSEWLCGVINKFYELPYVCVERINRCLTNCDLALQIGQMTYEQRAGKYSTLADIARNWRRTVELRTEIKLTNPNKKKRL